jgi:hypothetical protein
MKAINNCGSKFLAHALLLLMAFNCQAQVTSALPRDQYGAVIAPDPTPEQRELGKQLLEKILDVMLTIPLSEPERLIRALGFERTSKAVYPTNEYTVSKGRNEGATGAGLSSASVTKLTGLPAKSNQPPYNFTSSFNRGIACIHVDDALPRVSPLAQRIEMSDRVRIHPYPLAPRQKLDVIDFWGIRHSFGRIDILVLSFDYQFCATRVSINYTPLTQGE